MIEAHVFTRVIAAAMLASLGACASPLPVYPASGVRESLGVLAERAADLESFTGGGTLTVHNPERGTVTLEAAVVARKPDQLRVRAWKLGRSMADITLDGEEVVEKMDRRVEAGSLTEGLRGVRAVLLAIDERFYANAAELPGTDAATLVVRGVTADGTPMVCEIDRRTLTLREVRVDRESDEGASFTLEKYREIDGTVWPMRIRAVRGDREATLRLDWVEPNAQIAPGALPDRETTGGEP